MLLAPAADVVDRQISRNPVCPRTESCFGIESRVCFVNSPECLYRQILRDARVPHDLYNPAKHFSLELPKQCLESVYVALFEALQQLHLPVLLPFTNPQRASLHFFPCFWERRNSTSGGEYPQRPVSSRCSLKPDPKRTWRVGNRRLTS